MFQTANSMPLCAKTGSLRPKSTVDVAVVHGKRTMFDRVCRELVKRHREGLGLICRNMPPRVLGDGD